ncbi:type II toxin-antitoxin system VapC family toxin [Jiella sp. M17.18]|uniref:type II toxin-antitoxin system VapC family toxin n=1 Tax=Jiella sp. M17.18 TaxID=3234247 RepID=UPI0034DFABEC
MEPPPVYLDTNVLIALIEPVAPLTVSQKQFVTQLDAGRVVGITSEIALSECLVKPLADDAAQTINAYLALFSSQSWLAVLPVSRDVLVEAAVLRSIHRMALPDAIHVASARLASATLFISDDRRLKTPSLERTSWSDLPELGQ